MVDFTDPTKAGQKTNDSLDNDGDCGTQQPTGVIQIESASTAAWSGTSKSLVNVSISNDQQSTNTPINSPRLTQHNLSGHRRWFNSGSSESTLETASDSEFETELGSSASIQSAPLFLDNDDDGEWIPYNRALSADAAQGFGVTEFVSSSSDADDTLDAASEATRRSILRNIGPGKPGHRRWRSAGGSYPGQALQGDHVAGVSTLDSFPESHATSEDGRGLEIGPLVRTKSQDEADSLERGRFKRKRDHSRSRTADPATGQAIDDHEDSGGIDRETSSDQSASQSAQDLEDESDSNATVLRKKSSISEAKQAGGPLLAGGDSSKEEEEEVGVRPRERNENRKEDQRRKGTEDGALMTHVGHVRTKRSFKQSAKERLYTGAMYGAGAAGVFGLVALGVAICFAAPPVGLGALSAITVLKIAGGIAGGSLAGGFVWGIASPANRVSFLFGGEPVGKCLGKAWNVLRQGGLAYSQDECKSMEEISDDDYRALLYVEHPRGRKFAAQRLAIQAAIIDVGIRTRGDRRQMIQAGNDLEKEAQKCQEKDGAHPESNAWLKFYRSIMDRLGVSEDKRALFIKALYDQKDVADKMRWDSLLEELLEEAASVDWIHVDNQSPALELEENSSEQKQMQRQDSVSSLRHASEDGAEEDDAQYVHLESLESPEDLPDGKVKYASDQELRNPVGEYLVWWNDTRRRPRIEEAEDESEAWDMTRNEWNALSAIPLKSLRDLLNVPLDNRDMRKRARINIMDTIFWNLEDEYGSTRGSTAYIERLSNLADKKEVAIKEKIEERWLRMEMLQGRKIPIEDVELTEKEEEQIEQEFDAKLPQLWATENCLKTAWRGRDDEIRVLKGLKQPEAENSPDQGLTAIEDDEYQASVAELVREAKMQKYKRSIKSMADPQVREKLALSTGPNLDSEEPPKRVRKKKRLRPDPKSVSGLSALAEEAEGSESDSDDDDMEDDS